MLRNFTALFISYTFQVFVGELDQSGVAEKQLVAVKHLLRNATDKDK